jgi:hypothetical protein
MIFDARGEHAAAVDRGRIGGRDRGFVAAAALEDETRGAGGGRRVGAPRSR